MRLSSFQSPRGIDIDDYILKGEESAQRLSQLLNGVIGELRQKLAPYKKA